MLMEKDLSKSHCIELYLPISIRSLRISVFTISAYQSTTYTLLSWQQKLPHYKCQKNIFAILVIMTDCVCFFRDGMKEKNITSIVWLIRIELESSQMSIIVFIIVFTKLNVYVLKLLYSATHSKSIEFFVYVGC